MTPKIKTGEMKIKAFLRHDGPIKLKNNTFSPYSFSTWFSNTIEENAIKQYISSLSYSIGNKRNTSFLRY
jgi:hypothetical protein